MGGLYWSDNHCKLYNSDCRSMSDLSDESVQMVVTSPPYWGLRKYAGNQDLIWGGDEKCEHRWADIKPPRMATPGDRPSAKSLIAIKRTNNENRPMGITNACSLCSAWRGAYGLEPTPELYVQHTIEILREIRRVLRKDGCVFLNIGDSYMSSGGASRHFGYTDPKHPVGRKVDYLEPTAFKHKTIKPKDLCLIPFRVAIAAQQDGWWVRSVIIWSKPNPMPSSVTDRPSTSHEFILMLTKSARYFWDAEAVREPHTNSFTLDCIEKASQRPITNPFSKEERYTKNQRGISRGELGALINPSGRNLRSVWTINTQPYKKAHFATYPEKLVEICVKAATPEVGCCPKCGKPWVRIIKSNSIPTRPGYKTKREGQEVDIGGVNIKFRTLPQTETLGWKPACKCGLDQSQNVPSVCLDPFSGSGTTLWVAKKLGRRSVGYELSEEYCKLAIERNRQASLNLY